MTELKATKGPWVERVCSMHGDRRGPAKGAGHKDGGMSRSPYHIAEPGTPTTLCGRNRMEWLLIDRTTIQDAISRSDCCVRCAALAAARGEE